MARKLHPWLEFIYSGRLRIVDRNGRLVSFHPTWIQNNCFQDWNIKLNRREHIRELILKPRQVKISTAVSAFIIAASLSEDNLASLVGNLDEKQQKKLWEQKYRTLCSRMLDPETGEDITVEFDNYALDRIKFTKTGSNIYNEIHGYDLGRGATAQIAHLTEFPFWENAEPVAILDELMCSIPDGYPTCVFIESTAAKDGDWFETTFRKSWKAQRNRDAISPIWNARFYSWFQNEEYQAQRITTRQMQIVRETLDDEERHLLELMNDPHHGALGCKERDFYAKLLWRREKVADMDATTFRKNYPATIDDAFRSKRVSVFDHQSLDWYSRQRREPEFVGRVELDQLERVPSVERFPNGPLHVWEPPTIGHQYVIGVDVGNEGSTDKNRSFTGMSVVDVDTQAVVATWRGMANPWGFAEQVYALGKHYNTALVAVERAAGGVTVISRMVNELGYPNLYSSGSFVSGETSYGFNTSANSRPKILDYLRWCIRHKVLELPCTRTQREMENFREDNNGKMKAPKGMTDDLVLSLAIACDVGKTENWRPRDRDLNEEIQKPEPSKRIITGIGAFDDIEDLMNGQHTGRSPFEKYMMGA